MKVGEGKFATILNPDKNWTAVYWIGKDAPLANNWRMLTGERQPAGARQIADNVYLIPSEKLASEQRLLAMAETSQLPAVLFRTYRGPDGKLVAPVGTITVKPKDQETRKAVLDFAKSKGLKLHEESDRYITLRFSNESLFEDIFAAAAALERSGMATFVEVDTSFEITKFGQEQPDSKSN